jgi:hypothetical protein
MTLLDAPTYNARRANLLRNIGIAAAILVVVLGVCAWFFWDWPEEHRVNRFLGAVEAQDFNKAFADWNNDPDWQQHPERYKTYDFGRFQQDWGPASDYGVIRSHKIIMAKTVGNGVVMGVNINGGKTPIFLRVDHATKQIGFSPFELYTGP